MKHFINILVLLLLSAFIVALTMMIYNLPPTPKGEPTGFGVLYLPSIGFFFFWLNRLNEQYK